MSERLYRVYLQTNGHELTREFIVTATDSAQAHERALEHVKASNISKGERTKEESVSQTQVLAVVPTTQRHALCINEIPSAAVRQIAAAMQ